MNSSRNTVLQLYPPKIDLQTKDIVGAQIGVPLHAVIIYPPELVFKRARVSIDPPLAGTVEEHDDVRLWATLDPALVGPVTEADLSDSTRAPLLLDATTIKADVNAPIELHIKESQFLTDVVVYLFYTIERKSENLGTSPPLSYIYNRIRPGIKDDLTVPGGHSKLKLLLPDEIKNGVGPGFTTARVAVQYPYARAYDRISFMCNGKILEVSVGPTEAPEPPDHGSETPTTLYFDVDRAFLELAKQQDHRMAFLFTVYDQLNNSADPDAQWSKPQFVDEDLDGTRLAKPVLREQLNDPGDTPDIDLGKLKDKPLLIVIAPTDIRFVAGYKVTTFYTATHPDHPDVFDEQSSTVTEDEFGQKQLIVIEVPNHKVSVPGSTVNVFYELRKPDNADGSPGALVGISNTTSALVVGAALELKPPSVLQANGAPLNPMNALNLLTIVVPQGALLGSDLLSVCWIAKPGTHPEGSITTPPRPISEIGLSIDIPPSVLAFCLGDSVGVIVSYIITRDGIPLPSETLPLTVLDLPQSVLPAPRLKEAANAGEGVELRLSELTSDGKMWFSGFPFNIAGQFVWLLLKGTHADGSAYEKYIWAAPFAFVNDDWVKNGYYEATAPYEDLKGLKDGTPLTMEMWVAFGKSEDLGLAKRFLLRTYTVTALDLKNPSIKEANGNSLNPFAAKDTLTAVIAAYSNMIGTQVSVTWAGTPGEGSVTVGPIDVTAQADKEIPLPNSVVPFNLGKAVKVTCTVTRNGTLLGSKEVTLNVQPIVDGDNNLPTPTIDGAPDEELDLTDLADDARTRIAMWPLIAVGQKFWLRYSGIDEDDNPYERLFYDGVTVEFGDLNGLLPLAPYEQLRTLKGGSELKIEFKISYDGSTNENQAVTSPIRRYTIMATPKLCIDTTPFILDGTNVVLTDPQGRWSRTADPTGAIERRAACGGTPPYTYESEDPTIASVDDRGVVRSTGNGETIISVKDSMNVAISFEVRTSNVYELAITAQTFPTCMDAAAGISAVGGTMIDNENAAEMIKIITALSHAYRPIQPPYASYVTESFYTGKLISDGYPKQYWEVIAMSGLSKVHESYGPGFAYSAYWTHVTGGNGYWVKLRAIYLM